MPHGIRAGRPMPANGVGNNRLLIDRLRRADDGATPSNRSAAMLPDVPVTEIELYPRCPPVPRRKPEKMPAALLDGELHDWPATSKRTESPGPSVRPRPA